MSKFVDDPDDTAVSVIGVSAMAEQKISDEEKNRYGIILGITQRNRGTASSKQQAGQLKESA